MPTPKALIFDVDGTLADTERDGHRVAFNQAFKQANLNWHWSIETYGKLLAVTGGKERIRHFIQNDKPSFKPPENLNDFILNLHNTKTRHFVALLESGKIPLRPGVERLLREARQKGIRLAIATTTTAENVSTLLSATLGEESIQWFDVIAAGDVVPKKKPAPDIFLYALQQLNLSADKCLAFEDSDNGLKSASRAGLKTIVTINEYTAQQDFSEAVIVLDQLGEADAGFKVIHGDSHGATIVDIPMIIELFNH